ncbi:metalloprotease, putative [Plasmodium chabaudi chabaudi]|uniref:Metalloprotease, putative n=1 Tax=Plasmodium chabaudi chabaudi TaxID=31271 RepID=A0A1D3LGJ4_PLACU|nr:metalloprotease, putative [Plasmodium chabaudi chabaudi]
MMDELQNLVEKIKKCIQNVDNKIKNGDLRKNIEKFLLNNRTEKGQFNDMVSLIQYSLKYKDVCNWPNYNDLFIINYNINNNFKSIIQKNENFLRQYKNHTSNEYEENVTTESSIKNDMKTTNPINTDKNISLTMDNEMNNKKNVPSFTEHNKVSENNQDNIAGKGNNSMDQNLVDKIKLNSKGANTNPKLNNINIQYNDDITLFNKLKLQTFMYFVRNNYKVKLLIDSLSAMNHPINIIYINCPNNKYKKKNIFQKISDLFLPDYKVNDEFVNSKYNYQKNNCSCSELPSNPLSNNNYAYTQKKNASNYTGGYNPISNTVWLCANNITNLYKLKYILTHELIHAFDFARANIDMYNCHHIACSEIRAYNMSNQCGYFNSKHFVPNRDVFNHFKAPSINDTAKNKCVYNNTYTSLYQYKPCANNTHKYINDVFEKCIHDYWPFMCAPEQDSKYKPSKT